MRVEVMTSKGRPGWTTRAAVLLPNPITTPFTFWYLAVLLATTILQRVVGETVSAKLLAMSSTDALNLWHRPVMSLISSALWISDSGWAAYVVIFALAVAPLERRVGAGWTFAVFASGHVLATLATELPVMWALRGGLLPRTDGRWLDIGVSYGFFATAGAMVTVLAPGLRRWAALAILLCIGVIYVTDEPGSLLAVVTLAGHLTAALIGLFGWRGWVHRRGLAGTLKFRGTPFRAERDRVRPAAALAGSTRP
ncbi:MAG TPA: rhomboid-like protein [Amycolatopsis sp.]|uniref:rhomboid-like protein n=1 Tax=Amycolatopsis sp. TaxID=37632 RepID=UPI002B491EB4|nr:rhomboid-like protein [Amycolatopsis sp.]HKS44454.1 rhomboid-like protein [Amycolatopsis sp.]